MSTETLSIRINFETKRKLEELARQTRRSKSFLAAEAIAAYVDLLSWQVGQIQKGIDDCDSGRVIPHEDVEKWLLSWGSRDELPPP